MSIDSLYASIIDLRLNTDRTLERLEQQAVTLRNDGDRAGARQLIGHALKGTSFMPHHKKRLRAFVERELDEIPAADA